MNDTTVEFKTHEGQPARVTLRDTLRGDIRFAVLRERFASDEQGDQGFRFDFCWVLSRLVAVAGLDGWTPVDETASEDEFTACYHGFAERVDTGTFYDLVRAVNALRQPVANAIEKPEDALTEAEAADPN